MNQLQISLHEHRTTCCVFNALMTQSQHVMCLQPWGTWRPGHPTMSWPVAILPAGHVHQSSCSIHSICSAPSRQISRKSTQYTCSCTQWMKKHRVRIKLHCIVMGWPGKLMTRNPLLFWVFKKARGFRRDWLSKIFYDFLLSEKMKPHKKWRHGADGLKDSVQVHVSITFTLHFWSVLSQKRVHISYILTFRTTLFELHPDVFRICSKANSERNYGTRPNAVKAFEPEELDFQCFMCSKNQTKPGLKLDQ